MEREIKMKDTKFSVAIHILIMLATSNQSLNSDDLAQSVGTNASYIRKIMALLKKAKLLLVSEENLVLNY